MRTDHGLIAHSNFQLLTAFLLVVVSFQYLAANITNSITKETKALKVCTAICILFKLQPRVGLIRSAGPQFTVFELCEVLLEACARNIKLAY